MSKLKVSDLNPPGFQLFQDSETFLIDLNDDDLYIAGGGISITTRISVIQIPASEDIYQPSISFIW
ncbi:hypothetical protein H6G54_07890 [Anabaena cylindrica FACHB-243]|uniref:Uncharacterized protein n=1 Tax=Anabaena cylindrica (strain ATCC 27899 / PCC 7122) TaxID=272123 RepID=K9ZMB6_ANACC|nr:MULTISPECIES: hypothetical protein [Anabaena]AFZ59470.1 hypothetical protein Anacy_4102 [Anabaena cylindrica PCC 7122]MBD2417625.1 hypothetical protein [Anabaena cylindrica FACHB-243]MBY5283257.1 hypothetical protein [Anabaena sp. CCAP 1446/1C]MBY5310625.1 hypothetical protein [Anabaena sp. CCAP 1446/1C]MCM2405386.1 hypothetical protein [Anabaena sp. CCAP 1446/1C]